MRLGKSSLLLHPYLLLFISILAVAFSSILIKSSDTPTSVAGMYRLFITVLFLLPFVPFKTVSTLRLPLKEWLMTGAAGLFLGLHFLFWMESLSYTSVASSMVILTLQPLFVMIGSYYMFKERLNLRMVLCMMAAVLGSIVIAWGDIGISREALLGDGLSLLGTIAVSAYMLTGQKASRNVHANLYSVLVFFIGGCVMLVYNLMFSVSLTGYQGQDWLYFVLLAIIPTLFGQFIFNLLLKTIGATTVSVGIIGEPVLAILMAYLLLHESISSSQWVGGIFTIAGMCGYFWVKAYKAKPRSIHLTDKEPIVR